MYVAPPVQLMATDTSAPSGYSPLLSLALFESVRALDAHVPDELDEVHLELGVKRLGQSSTVAAQIERLHRDVRRGDPIPATDVEALLRLVARRTDAGLVFTDAGRRLGRHLIRGLPLPVGIARLVGRQMTRRALRRIGIVLRGAPRPEAVATDDLMMRATPDGAACAFLGAAVAEVMRRLSDFDGAMIHVTCRGRGADACVWRPALASKEGP